MRVKPVARRVGGEGVHEQIVHDRANQLQFFAGGIYRRLYRLEYPKCTEGGHCSTSELLKKVNGRNTIRKQGAPLPISNFWSGNPWKSKQTRCSATLIFTGDSVELSMSIQGEQKSKKKEQEPVQQSSPCFHTAAGTFLIDMYQIVSINDDTGHK